MIINGGNITLTAGLQTISAPIIIGKDPGPSGDIIIEGQGTSTVLQRGANMPSGQGVLNIYGENIVIRDLVIDGAVTTPVGVNYSDITTPEADSLSLNTSIWIHPGAKTIRLENVTIRHSGGYSIFLDARTGYIANVEIIDCKFENNRAHLFGVNNGDLTYGSWTGGVFYKNLGTSSNSGAVNGLLVQGCTFNRVAGIGVWGHSDNFLEQHSDINVIGNTFVDIGRDGTELGNTTNCSVSNNSFHRIGYIALDDDGESTPKWTPPVPGCVAIDNTGLVKNCTIANNTIISVNGEGIDGDGLCDSVISGNTILQPDANDPHYATDKIAQLGPYSTGIQPGNTYYGPASQNLVISNNKIVNFGYWALSLSNLKNSVITNNIIIHPSTALGAPIVLFCKPGYTNGVYYDGNNEGEDGDHRSHGNVIANNRIHYDATQFAIAEINYNDGSDHNFKSSDVNRVFGNLITGSCIGEFQPSPDSGSFAGLDLPTNDHTSTSADINRIQREGKGNQAALKIHSIVGGSKKQMAQLSDAAFLNVSVDGTTKTGVVTTGNRGSTAYPDCVATGKLHGDAFLGLSDTAFADTDANLLDATWGLLRYNSAGSKFQVSTTVDSATRVWYDLVVSEAGTSTVSSVNGLTGAVSIVGTDNQIAVTATGSSVTLKFPDQVVFNGADGVAGLSITHGWLEALDPTNGGLYAAGNQFNVIKAPNGGVYVGLGVTMDQAAYLKSHASSSTLNSPGGGYTGFAHQSGSLFWFFNSNTSAWETVDFAQIGAGVTSLAGTANQISVSASTGSVTISLPQNIHSGADVTFETLKLNGSNLDALNIPNGYIQARGFASIGSPTYNSIQSLDGGFYAKYGYTADQGFYPKYYSAAAQLNNPTSGYGGIGYNGGANYWLWNSNGNGSWISVDFSKIVNSLTGTTNQVNVSTSSGNIVLSLPQNIDATANPTFNIVNATVGFSALGSAYNAIQTTNGGMYSKFGVTLDQALYMKTWSSTSGLNVPTGPYGGLAHKGGSQFWYYANNTWNVVDFGAISGGIVSSISGTANQVNVSGSTGSVAISLPQNIHTSADVTFSSLTLNSTSTAALNVPNGFITAKGIAANSSAYNAIQTTAGGIASAAGVTVEWGLYLKPYTSATLNAPGSGYGGFGYKGGSQYWYYNGATWMSFDFAAASVTSLSAGTGIGISSSSGAVQITNTGVTNLAAGSNLTVSNGGTGSVSVGLASSVIISGSMEADGGFYTPNTNYNAFQAPNGGGFFATGVTTNGGIILQSRGSMTGGTSGYGGLAYNSGSTYFYWNGFGWATADFSRIGQSSGVQNIYGGSGISVSGGGSSYTITNSAPGITYYGSTGVTVSGNYISIGQAVGTGNAVSFYSVTVSQGCNAAIHQSSGYNGITFQNTNASFMVDTSGNISGGGTCNMVYGYKVNGSQAINSSNQFVGNGASCPYSGIGGSGFNVFSNGSWSYGATFYFNDQGGTQHKVVGGIMIY